MNVDGVNIPVAGAQGKATSLCTAVASTSPEPGGFEPLRVPFTSEHTELARILREAELPGGADAVHATVVFEGGVPVDSRAVPL